MMVCLNSLPVKRQNQPITVWHLYGAWSKHPNFERINISTCFLFFLWYCCMFGPVTTHHWWKCEGLNKRMHPSNKSNARIVPAQLMRLVSIFGADFKSNCRNRCWGAHSFKVVFMGRWEGGIRNTSKTAFATRVPGKSYGQPTPAPHSDSLKKSSKSNCRSRMRSQSAAKLWRTRGRYPTRHPSNGSISMRNCSIFRSQEGGTACLELFLPIISNNIQ